ncbi:MAG: bifunctional (p)ppGpp synthetase/guanosine-3',5'-bis(diphosphate) 3'-pyrophosphohydrolase [Deltaproteobacteria bacterium]|jgi:GTP pyrophosphokinase|nr:bifunctional (p)ppGpp synthetase/guanosine-3',5'-bis(diphosphate) 3'-pyrophosphohydrolase [Deltaproteobacteria bacterium]
MIRIQEILDKVQSYRPDSDVESIRKAYVFAAANHAGQVRLSGEPYLSHPLAVADTLADLRLDDASIIVGLLHDTVEDTHATLEEIEEMFGPEVAEIVDGVTKISQIKFDSKEEQQAENIRKMILAMSEDIRVLIVKLADRMHNMRTLDFQKPEKQQRIAKETMDIYAPLANRIGLHRVKMELEDLSFKYIKPDAYDQIATWLNRHRQSDISYIADVRCSIGEMLRENEITGVVKGRIKHIYSIFRKMTAQSVSLDEMHDIIAFRVIVAELKDCYAVLGLVHAKWRPVPGRFKDYISMPKGNMYQSLHTTVAGPRGERMEIQIRTEEMDRLAENGLASHWLYKEGSRVKAKDVRQFNWLREMLDWQKVENDSKEFLRTLRFDLFKDEIYVFTPNGEVKVLPENATAVDFAYQVHSKVGDHCAGAKVNSKLVPLPTPLKSGDYVEIITNQNRHPSRDWLKYVKTAKARSRIQHYIRTEERERTVTLGRDILEKQGRRFGVNFQKAIKEIDEQKLAAEFNLKTLDDLYSAVGYSHVQVQRVLRALQTMLGPDKLDTQGKPDKTEKDGLLQQQQRHTPESTVREAEKREEQRKADSISITGGGDDILLRFAKCCNPVPGDHIIGYISRGRGITVHTADCPTIIAAEPERLLSINWDGQREDPFPTRIHILAKNVKGLLHMVSGVLMDENINIDSGTMRSNVDGRSEINLVVEVRDTVQLYQVMSKLRHIKEVLEVVRSVAPESKGKQVELVE